MMAAATKPPSMTQPNITLHCFAELDATPALIAGLDEVFFAASNTTSFESAVARAAFRERWLGRYLEHDARFAFVAMAAGGCVAGYVVGSADDPALAPRFADIAYFQAFKGLTAKFPAHLHVNLGPDFRGQGLGGDLIARFAHEVGAVGAGGMHVVTSRGARNVAFYARNGFDEAGAMAAGAGEIVFLAKNL
jgi:GNAT superfamily N-acetyltransferase